MKVSLIAVPFVNGCAIGTGLYWIYPTITRANDGEKATRDQFEQFSEKIRIFQKYADDHCHKLGVRSVIILELPPDSKPEESHYTQIPGLGPIVRLGGLNTTSEDQIKGVLNHELGHHFYGHDLQREAVSTLIGAMCCLKRFRKIGCISVFFQAILEKTWFRFQERQADAHCIRYSTAKELQAVANLIKIKKQKCENPLLEKLRHTLYDTHPYGEERIDAINEGLKSKQFFS